MNFQKLFITITFFLFLSSFNYQLEKTSYIFGIIYKQNNNTSPNIKIEVYTKPNGKGEKLISLKTNKNGEFKSSKPIDFTNGLYPSVKNGNITLYMKFPIKTGNCLICHKTNKIKI